MQKVAIDSIAASAVDLAYECSASLLPAEHPHNPNSEGARLGTAVHEYIAQIIESRPRDVDALASVHDVDADEVERLADYSWQAIEGIDEPITGGRAEVKVYEGNIRSRQDYLAVQMSAHGPEHISSLDWKSGRVKTPRPGQMLANAAALRRKYGMPASGYIYTAEVWLRDREVIERRADGARLDAFEERLAATLKYAGRSYSPGPHCGFCPHSTTCQARVDYLRASTTMLAHGPVQDLTREALADLWPRSRAVKMALAEYEKVVETTLKDGGAIQLSDGTSLELRPKTKTNIDPKAAWPVMVNSGLTDQEIAGVLTIGKGKLERAVSAKAPRGEKKSTIGAMMADLRAAGALETTTYHEKHHKKKI